MKRTLVKKFAALSIVAGLVGTGSAAAAIGSRGSTPKASNEPHGVNFVVNTALDTSFCLQVNQSGSKWALELDSCNHATEAQKWVFAWTKAGPVVALSVQGKCWSASPSEGAAAYVLPCTFGSSEKFLYTSTSRFTDTTKKWCLATSVAAARAKLFMEKCDATNKGQVWNVGH